MKVLAGEGAFRRFTQCSGIQLRLAWIEIWCFWALCEGYREPTMKDRVLMRAVARFGARLRATRSGASRNTLLVYCTCFENNPTVHIDLSQQRCASVLCGSQRPPATYCAVRDEVRLSALLGTLLVGRASVVPTQTVRMNSAHVVLRVGALCDTLDSGETPRGPRYGVCLRFMQRTTSCPYVRLLAGVVLAHSWGVIRPIGITIGT